MMSGRTFRKRVRKALNSMKISVCSCHRNTEPTITIETRPYSRSSRLYVDNADNVTLETIETASEPEQQIQQIQTTDGSFVTRESVVATDSTVARENVYAIETDESFHNFFVLDLENEKVIAVDLRRSQLVEVSFFLFILFL